MNRRLLLILIAALIGGVSASYVVYRLVGGRLGPAAPPMAEVVVAAHDLAVGSSIGPADVRIGHLAGALPKGALVKTDAALNRGVTAAIYEGEPVIADRLAMPGTGGGLAAMIPAGMRASAVRVNDVVGLAGFVTPGMRVDVLVTGIAAGGNTADGTRVATLLQNIQVLSAGGNLQKDSEGKPQIVQVVNLLVTPEQAEKLSLASNQTQIQLVLRNPLDAAITTPPGTKMAELFGSSSVAPSRAPRPAVSLRARSERREKPAARPLPVEAHPAPTSLRASRSRVVEIFNGATRTEIKFNAGEDAP
jgi:pilus assembly protein CpaB